MCWEVALSVQFHLFTRLSNRWDLIGYFLTLTLPYNSDSLWLSSASIAQRQRIIPDTLARSSVKNHIRWAQGQPVSDLSLISLMAQQFKLAMLTALKSRGADGSALTRWSERIHFDLQKKREDGSFYKHRQPLLTSIHACLVRNISLPSEKMRLRVEKRTLNHMVKIRWIKHRQPNGNINK